MSQDETPPDVEFLDVGPAPDHGGASRLAVAHRWARWWPLLFTGLLAAAVITVLRTNKQPSAPHSSRPPSARHSSPSRLDTPVTSHPAAPAAPVNVLELGHRLLGVTAGWELFARAPGVVLRIQLAQGRITQTAVPQLDSSGAVSFVAAADRAIVRPWDYVAGYEVPDGRPARELTGAFASGGPTLPGPKARQLWVQRGDNQHATMVLVNVDGTPAGASIRIPAGMDPFVQADGAGYLLITGTGGVYAARPGSLHRITTGALLAVGPTGWLVDDCDDRHRCTVMFVDSVDRTRRVAHRPPGDPNRPVGAICPDGKTAVLLDYGASTGTVQLFDLSTGTDRNAGLSVDSSTDASALACSPDSRWAFVAGSNGRLSAVDTRTGKITALGVPLPGLRQLAIRSAHS